METQPLDRCDQCGFDADEWDDRDTTRTIALAPQLVRLWAESVPRFELNTRPSSEVWSIAEYAEHLREVFFAMRFLVDTALSEPGKNLGPAVEPGPPGDHRRFDAEQIWDGFDAESALLAEALRPLRGDRWVDSLLLGGRNHSIRWAARHAVHDLWHHLGDLATIATALDVGLNTQRGSVRQISRSSGGVPKTEVAVAEIGRSGVEGDRQAARAHHGRPWQALCLWSSEVIDALIAEGHPITPGAAGENLTLEGLDWSTLHGGAIVEIGSMLAQLSAPAVPCSKNDRWFADGSSRRMDHDLHPGWSRWYATVLSPGRVEAGDSVTLRRPRATIARPG